MHARYKSKRKGNETEADKIKHHIPLPPIVIPPGNGASIHSFLDHALALLSVLSLLLPMALPLLKLAELILVLDLPFVDRLPGVDGGAIAVGVGGGPVLLVVGYKL